MKLVNEKGANKTGLVIVLIGFIILIFSFIIAMSAEKTWLLILGFALFLAFLIWGTLRWSKDIRAWRLERDRKNAEIADNISARKRRARTEQQKKQPQDTTGKPNAEPGSAPAMSILKLVESLRMENAQLRKRIREMEQAPPKPSAKDAEINARSLAHLADALSEYKAIIAQQKDRICELEAALDGKVQTPTVSDDLKQSPAYQIAALKSRIIDLEEQLQQSGKRYNPQWEQIDLSKIAPATVGHIDPSGALYGKRVVFTGALSMPRKEAMQLAADCGAVLQKGVTMETDYLICGAQDPLVVGADGLSRKLEKALRYNAEGRKNIQMIDEAQFMQLVTKQ